MRYPRLQPGTIVQVDFPEHPYGSDVAIVAGASKDGETLWIITPKWPDSHVGGWVISRSHVKVLEGDDHQMDSWQVPRGSIVIVDFKGHPFDEFSGVVQGSSVDDRIRYVTGKLWPANPKGGWPILDVHLIVKKMAGENHAN